jgi:hypothetical protein
VRSNGTREQRMTRHVLVFICLLPAVFLPAVSEAQEPKKVSRIGYLSNSDPARESARAEAIRRVLRDMGT